VRRSSVPPRDGRAQRVAASTRVDIQAGVRPAIAAATSGESDVAATARQLMATGVSVSVSNASGR
jgi:hypothetical protein